MQYLMINDKEYPLLFTVRSMFDFMNGNDVSIEDGSMKMDYDVLLESFSKAISKGIDKEDSELEKLSAEEIEESINDNPKLFMELQEAFNECEAIKAFQ